MQIFDGKMQIYGNIMAGHSEDGKHLIPSVKAILLDVSHEITAARLLRDTFGEFVAFVKFINSSERTDLRQAEGH